MNQSDRVSVSQQATETQCLQGHFTLHRKVLQEAFNVAELETCFPERLTTHVWAT
jgi:hypothetical protein